MNNANVPMAYAFEPRNVQNNGGIDSNSAVNVVDVSNFRLDARLADLAWCNCGHCIIMPSARECICCHEIEQISMRINATGCITTLNRFNTICIDNEALETALLSMAPFRSKKLILPLHSRLVIVIKSKWLL